MTNPAPKLFRAMLPLLFLAACSDQTPEPTQLTIPPTASPTNTQPATFAASTFTPAPSAAASLTPLPYVDPPVLGERMLPRAAVDRLGMGFVRIINLSPDGMLLAVGTTSAVALLHADTLQPVWTISAPGPVDGLLFSPDGEMLAVWLDDSPALVFLDTNTGERDAFLGFQWFDVSIADVAWSPTGDDMLIGLMDGRVIDFYTPARAIIKRDLRLNHPEPRLASVAWSPDGKLVAAGGDFRTVNVWNWFTGTLMVSLPPAEIGWAPISALAFSPDSRYLAASTGDPPNSDAPDYDERIYLWDLQTKTQRFLEGHTHSPYTLAWSPDGRFIASVASPEGGGELILWDAASNFAPDIHEIEIELGTAAWLPDGRHLITAGEQRYEDTGSAMVWDTLSGEQVLAMPADEPILDIFVLPDGSAFGAMMASAITLWDAASGEIIATEKTVASLDGLEWSLDSSHLKQTTTTPVSEDGILATSPDGQKQVHGGSFTRFGVYDTASGDHLFALAGYEGYPVIDADWSSDGAYIAAAINNSVWVWDASNGTLIYVHDDHDSGVLAVAFSPDSTMLVSAGGREPVYGTGEAWGWDENAIHIWDTATGTLLQKLWGHVGPVRDLLWSPDGTRLASGSEDGTILIWQIIE
jgi:WD40 repeat protein